MLPEPAYRVYLCGGMTCRPHTLPALHAHLEQQVWQHGLLASVAVRVGTCQGRCEHAPNLTIFPGGYRYATLTPQHIERIVREHLAQGTPVADLLHEPPHEPTQC